MFKTLKLVSQISCLVDPGPRQTCKTNETKKKKVENKILLA